MRHVQLVAPVFVNQLDGGAVLLRALEIVAGDVVAEDAPGDLVLLEQRGAGEADEGGVRQREAHVACQPSRLGAVGLVRDHDDIVALAVGFVGVHILVELVDQAEDVTVVLLQDALEVGT